MPSTRIRNRRSWKHAPGRRMAVLAVVVALIAAAGPALGVGSEDFTGDTTAPFPASLTVVPGNTDTTAADASFSVTVRIVEDFSGVDGGPSVSAYRDGTSAMVWGSLTLTSGDDRDGTWSGAITIPRGTPGGHWSLNLQAFDRAYNWGIYDAAALAARGLPSGIDTTSTHADTSPPAVVALQASASLVDVRTGPASIQFTARATDPAGVSSLHVGINRPGGVGPQGAQHSVEILSTDVSSLTLRVTYVFPEHVAAGRWTIDVYAEDWYGNRVMLEPAHLQAAGMPSWFDVLSVEDTQRPVIHWVRVDPVAVNVHDEMQTVKVQMRVTDDLSGVTAAMAWIPPTPSRGPVMCLPTSFTGNGLDGVWECTLRVPRSFATGLMSVQPQANDAAGNYAVPTEGLLLVYNVPSAPTLLELNAAERSAIIRWDPPADDGGSPVTGYVVTVSPGNVRVQVAADATSAVVSGLANGVPHSFSVQAVNRAGLSEPSAPLSGVPGRSGYWLLSSDGLVHAFGDAAGLGSAPVGDGSAVDIEPTPSRRGYWVADAAGHVFAFGDARWMGNAPSLQAGESVTSIAATPGGGGYWLFTNRGRVLTFGNAPFLGDMSHTVLNGPVLNSLRTPDGRGYYMVASDGGVFTFGTARFSGSMGSTPLNAPVQSLVADADGLGYWLVASDGGIFTFDAVFHGSMGDKPLNSPITGMVSSGLGRGYLMVAADGGAFTFGDVAFRGSLGGNPPPSPVVAAAGL